MDATIPNEGEPVVTQTPDPVVPFRVSRIDFDRLALESMPFKPGEPGYGARLNMDAAALEPVRDIATAMDQVINHIESSVRGDLWHNPGTVTQTITSTLDYCNRRLDMLRLATAKAEAAVDAFTSQAEGYGDHMARKAHSEAPVQGVADGNTAHPLADGDYDPTRDPNLSTEHSDVGAAKAGQGTPAMARAMAKADQETDSGGPERPGSTPNAESFTIGRSEAPQQNAEDMPIDRESVRRRVRRRLEMEMMEKELEEEERANLMKEKSAKADKEQADKLRQSEKRQDRKSSSERAKESEEKSQSDVIKYDPATMGSSPGYDPGQAADVGPTTPVEEGSPESSPAEPVVETEGGEPSEMPENPEAPNPGQELSPDRHGRHRNRHR